MTTLFLVVIVGLFFIPELVDLQQSVKGAFTDEELVAKSELLQEDTGNLDGNLQLEAEPWSPLADVIADLENKEQERAQLRLASLNRETLRELEDEEAEDEAVPDGTFLEDQRVSWRGLRTDQSKTLLRNARGQAQKLLLRIPDEHKATRFALNNYLNGLKRLASGEKQGLRDEELLDYMQAIDMAVTRSMLAENVDRLFYLRWADISLGSLLEGTAAIRFKQANLRPFQPTIRLHFVQAYKPGDMYGRYVPRRDIFVTFWGYVEGRDVKRLELYKDGVFYKRLGLQRKPDRQGRRKFRVPKGRVRGKEGVFTIIAYDVEGNTYEQSYEFFRHAQQFPWTARERGTFELPFHEGDRRLDKYFRVEAPPIKSEAAQLLAKTESGFSFF